MSMFVVTYRRVSEQIVVVEAADEAAARERFPTMHTDCDYCGSEPLEPDVIVSVDPA